MSFDDIDTPVSQAELYGDEQQPETVADPAVEVVEDADAVAPVEEQAVEPVVEEVKEEIRSPVIPRARFDEVNQKLHAEREAKAQLEAQLAEMRQAQQQAAAPADADVDALEQAYFDATMEGNKASALKIRAQINAELQRRAEILAAKRAEEQFTTHETQRSFANAVAETIKTYPFLDINSAEANQEAIGEVVEWRDFLISKGESPASALSKAAARVAPNYVQPEPQQATTKVTDIRKAAAVSRNANASAAQPAPNDAGVGNRAAAPAYKVDTQEDWERLPAAERKRLLGA